MPSLENDFRELRQRLKDQTRLRNTGGDPVWYLVFSPAHMLKVKRSLKAWQAQLRIDGWDVEMLSLGEVIEDFFTSHPLRRFWLSGEPDHTLEVTNQTLTAALVDSRAVEQRILEAVSRLAERPHGLLVITDVEALHPYLRIGAIEQNLQGRTDVPVVVLYPGVRRGKFNLSFLGIYPDDGNYRSEHVGG